VPGPYVLAGHSVGGTYAMVYAAEYPDDVAGLALLDSASPQPFTALPDFPGRRLFVHAASHDTALERLGAGPLLSSGAPADLPAQAQMQAIAWSTRELHGERDEVAAYPALFKEAQALTGVSAPLVVVTATAGDRQAGWPAAQDAVAELTPTRSHRLVPGTHTSLLLDAADFAYSVAAIDDVLQAARTNTAVPES
jgi:pimeloyl-ACP methyl ester carboxylesterase